MRESTPTELHLGDLDKLPADEAARLHEWLIEKIDALCTRLKVEPKEDEVRGHGAAWHACLRARAALLLVLHGRGAREGMRVAMHLQTASGQAWRWGKHCLLGAASGRRRTCKRVLHTSRSVFFRDINALC